VAETLEPKVKDVLRSYVHDIKSLPNEAAKRSRFMALIAELFPGTNAVTQSALGIEKLIRIESEKGVKRGRADAYYGNAIIEFEKSLAATLEEAERQLVEYVAGTWQKDKTHRPMVAVASDGLTWKVYRPVLAAGAHPTPDTVTLEELRTIKVGEDTLSTFWLFLTSFLFRPHSIEPTAERFQFDFGSSFLYGDTLAALRRAWAKVSVGSEAKLAFETWQKYLTVTYGSLTETTTATKDTETAEEISELENLFLRHTYLVSIARMLIWAALSGGKTSGSLGEEASRIFSGEFFESKRLANLVDDDFFHWTGRPDAHKILAPAWERILSHLLEYDLSHIREDVLKGVYQELIDPKDRHYLGEYYTPDWLCERIVAELLPKEGYKPVLDPSCGSGSFLRAAITHYLNHNSSGTPHQRLRAVLGTVQGIDIHPVAVTIARATYVLALGSLVNSAKKPIQIPVYMADSLFLPREVEKSLYEDLSGIEITIGSKKTGQKSVVMPDMLVQSPEVFDDAIAACTRVAEAHAKTGKDSRKTMEKYLAIHVADLSKLLEYEKILDALWKFTEGLADLIREKKNSIWSFIVRNSYRPAMLKAHFDYIIGNPPWLAYRFIEDPEYQNEVKLRAVKMYRIAPTKMKLFTQMELATVFLAHTMATFAAKDARLAFVMPRAVLNADQHENLILRKYSPDTKLRLAGYWDLWDVSPLFNVPACVLFARRDNLVGNPREKLPVLEWQGTLPHRDVNWETAKKSLTSTAKEGRVIFLGSRAALSTAPGAAHASKPSKYQEVFKQGATMVPRSIYFVRVTDLDGAVDPERLYWAETDPEQAKEAKAPYKEVKMSGMVEGRFIFSTALSKNLVPFTLLDPVIIVLPVENKDGILTVRNAEELSDDGFREMGKWMQQAESIWNTKRKDKADKQSLYERLDYQKELTRQDLKHRYLVVYNHSGMNVSAAFYDRGTAKIPFIVDVKLYWAAFSNREEANYVAAILNSDTVNLAIKPFQSAGLLGERDIHKKLLELPIPTFDHEDPKHLAIAELGENAGKIAQKLVTSPGFPLKMSIARQRGIVRDVLAKELKEIDSHVIKLLDGK
jgi:N-6 DNA Methylase